MLNRNIEEFELGELIATGTAGKIYDAVEIQTGKLVAIKVLPSDVSKDRNIYIRFEREMVILGKLNHPNIVKYFGGGRFQDSLFYAMEKIDGGTLRQMINRHKKLTWKETARYGIRICSALQYMHNYGIIHRDIKPSNIFMTFDGEIKLGDFGIAFDSGESNLTDAGLIVGSYAYMAPEQIRGTQQTDSRADLYSLGCVLFEMLCGRPPFQGDTFAKIFDQHLTATPPSIGEFVRDVPVQLRLLIRRLLEKERHKRPFNARAAQGILSELNLNGDGNEHFYKREMSRLHQAFDRSTVRPESDEISWTKLAIAAAITGFLVIAGWALTSIGN
ncbi:serine/threonine protein kinase [Pirellulaceae bacterium]|jgi:serine/threonine protein kinase|nr:serine/threonine protein kinase [Pirellulaceae bacterium]